MYISRAHHSIWRITHFYCIFIDRFGRITGSCRVRIWVSIQTRPICLQYYIRNTSMRSCRMHLTDSRISHIFAFYLMPSFFSSFDFILLTIASFCMGKIPYITVTGTCQHSHEPTEKKISHTTNCIWNNIIYDFYLCLRDFHSFILFAFLFDCRWSGLVLCGRSVCANACIAIRQYW